ncbi:MAG: phage tail tape measure protein [Eubacterium sp.]|jgi:TP901 family phage tail tape measure protein|nr:phage tail tape measure protein [Eubacterium sp.]
MANRLSVIFNAVDNMSSRLSSIANIGNNSVNGFRRLEDAANQAFASVESGASSAGGALDRVAASSDHLMSAISSYEQEAAVSAQSSARLADAQDEAANELNEIVNAAGEASDVLANLENSTEAAGRRAEEFGNGTERARDHLGRFARSSREAEESVDGLGRGAAELGSLLASVGIVAALKEIGQAFADCAAQGEVFETSIAKLQTISGEDSIGRLQGEILALSNDTGQAADALADTAYNAISAGTAVEDSVNMAATASQLAVAGFTDTSSALSVLTTAINSYGDAAGSAEHISDSLVTVQNLGVTTVAELSQQMGKAISTASAYNVSLENLESGYISVTKAGINAAEGTTYLASMFNELGNTGSEISKVVREETGKTFGQLMNDGQSVADVLGLVYQKCNQDAEAMMNLWGSAEAGKAANAIISQGLNTFNQNLETLESSVGITADAYSVMADTTAYAHNKMDNAAKNLQTTIGSQLNPTLSKLYDAGADILTEINAFVEKNPAVVKAVTAVGIGLGVVVTGIAAVSFASSTAITAFGAAMNSALGPIGWIALAISGVVAAGAAFSTMMYDGEDAANQLTMKAREQEEELNNLNEEYERACEEHGKLSQEAGEVALKISELEERYGEAGETIGEFSARIDELGEKINGYYQKYEEATTAADELYDGSISLVSQLMVLSGQSDATGESIGIMSGIVDKLNSSYEDLGLTIDETTGKLNISIDDLYASITQAADDQKRAAAMEGLTNTLAEFGNAKLQSEEAAEEAAKAWENYKSIETSLGDGAYRTVEYSGAKIAGTTELASSISAWQTLSKEAENARANYDDMIGTIKDYCAELGYTDEETNDFVSQLESAADAADKATDSLKKIEDGTISLESAVQSVVDDVRDEMTALTEAYDEAYTSAMNSIEGQYSIWDSVGEIAKTSMSDLNAALDSQTQYWENYASNLDALMDKAGQIDGLGDMLKEMDDGSEQSAAALEAMANASDEQLEGMVQKYRNLQDAQSETAGSIADLESDFRLKLNEMSSQMEQTVNEMNMEAGAQEAARKTIQGYINGIQNMIPSVTTAAAAASAAATAALGGSHASNPPKTVIPVRGHASGTISSENAYIAGEDGPELIISGGSDTVFPASETDRIISAVSGNEDNPKITENAILSHTKGMAASSESSGSEEKIITIKLEGSGSVNVGKGASAEGLWDSVKNNFKQAFMSILQEEMYEEGMGAYEF